MAPRDDDRSREFLVDLESSRALDGTGSTDRSARSDRDERADCADELLDDGSADRACRPPSSGPEGWAFTILLIIPVPVILAVMIGSGMPPNQLFLLGAVVTLGPVVSLWLVVRLLWEPFRRRFPATHPTERVRWKRLQIVRLGLMGGFNHCVDVGADDQHVHLSLMMPFRLFARPMSIPRDAIEWGDGERPKSIFGMARVRIAGKRCLIPTWTFADRA